MNCDICSKEALSGDKFCRSCGSQLSEEEVYGCECGAEVRKDDKFCHGCGAPFSATGVCGCGNSLAENAKFCHNCGKNVVSEEQAIENIPENTSDEEAVLIEEKNESKGNYRQNTDGTFTFVKSK